MGCLRLCATNVVCWAGFYHSALMNTHHVSEETGLWDLARRCHDSVAHAVAKRKQFTDMGDLVMLMGQVRGAGTGNPVSLMGQVKGLCMKSSSGVHVLCPPPCAELFALPLQSGSEPTL